jgi:4'-phosphopantetheinyl transferase
LDENVNLHVVGSEPDAPLRLSKDEVHVWRASIDVSSEVQTALASSLDTEEQKRASQFVFDRDRNHFVAARGILRKLLSGYLQTPPEKLRFSAGPHGKPALDSVMGRADLRFNLSHSSGLMLLAVALEREVGIDVEKIESAFPIESTAASIFSARERAEFENRLPRHKQREFFQRWTCKEAYVKARGEGLQIPLTSFEVSLLPGEPPQLRSQDRSQWDLLSFFPRDDFAAALVVEGNNMHPRFWSWS